MRRQRMMMMPTAASQLLHLYLLLPSATSVLGVQETIDPRIVEHPDDLFVVRNEPATINCKAEGRPPPVITWYRNGHQVSTETDNPSSHRMLLPSGQLFFLRVHSKGNRSDAGVYYCNATNPVTGTSAVSRNATVAIAVIRDDFREVPQNSRSATGDTAVLQCRGPKGDPEPRILWKKDDKSLQTDERIQLQNGYLHLHDLRKSDSGMYVCVAQNHGGERETKPAQLTVHDKPKIIEVPSEVVTNEDSDILLPCRATGDPELSITWKKRKGVLPPHRHRILDDHTLRLKKVKVQDEGIFVCRAENGVGWQEIEIRIIVHSQPNFVTTPHSKWVGVGRRVSFECEATGNPVPAIFWKRENSQSLMFPDQTYGRYSIKQDGTLVIEQVEKSDAGVFICHAQSVAGSALTKSRLDVKDVDTRPPPIIFYGPQNQTLPISALATLQCSASGDPAPSIRWFKNNRFLSLNEPRFALLDSGTLQIHELRRSDTGWYTCKATSETGETSWSGSLSVEPPTDSSIIFRRTPDPSTYPGAPSRPVVSEMRETSVRLSWKPNSNHGASSVSAFTVEYFSHETGEGWTVASDRIQEPHHIVKGLRPDTVYRFLVRAQNSQGLSLPSPVTNPVRTKGLNSSMTTSAAATLFPDQTPLSKGPSAPTGSVLLRPPDAIGSKSMQLRWEVRRNPRFIDGFHIHYCIISRPDREADTVDLQPGLCDFQNAPPAIQTVQNGDARTHVLNHLEENTWYKISLRPFHQLTEGVESNSVYAKTLEDVPSAAPLNLQAIMSENSTLRMTWQPPPRQHHNGLLTGYKVFLSSNESSLCQDIWTNVSSDEIYVHNLSKDIVYSIQVAAYNGKGEGVRSPPLIVEYQGGVGGGSRKMGVTARAERDRRSPWLMVTVVACVGVVLWLSTCSLSVWLYRLRRRNGRQTKYSARQTKPRISSLGTETEQDESRGMLMENTYENVASAVAKASKLAAAPTKSDSAKVEGRGSVSSAIPSAGVGVGGASIAFPAPPPPHFPAASSEDNSPAYQQGLPINYPSSSGFSSNGQMDPFYENYIIKPKPVYACSSTPQSNSIEYTGNSSVGCYEVPPSDSANESVGNLVSQSILLQSSYCGFVPSKENPKFASNSSCTVAPSVDYCDAFRSTISPPTYNFNCKTSQNFDHTTETNDELYASQRPSSINGAVYNDFNHRAYDDDCHYPPYHYQPYHYHPVPYSSHTIQPRTTTELRLADSSPHATSEPEPFSTYIDDQSLTRDTTVVKYFSETDGLLNNSRMHQQYPPSPAPNEPLRTGSSLGAQQERLMTNRYDLGSDRNQSIRLNNERNLHQMRLTICSKLEKHFIHN